MLLIEAGGNEHFYMDIPVLATMLQFTDANWNYYTQPQVSLLLIEVALRLLQSHRVHGAYV